LGQVSSSCDVYAAAFCLIHLITGVPPYEMESHVFRILFEEHLPKSIPESLILLLQATTDPKLSLRLSDLAEIRYLMSEIRSNPSQVPRSLAKRKRERAYQENDTEGHSLKALSFYDLSDDTVAKKFSGHEEKIIFLALIIFALGFILFSFLYLLLFYR